MKKKASPNVRPQLITRDDVQAAIWRLTGWRGSVVAVDRLLRVIDEYALSHGARLDLLEAGRVTRPDPEEWHLPPLPPPPAGAAEGKLFRCNRCYHYKPQSEFHRDKSKKSGYRNICKVCANKLRAANKRSKEERDARNTRRVMQFVPLEPPETRQKPTLQLVQTPS